MGSEMCIRDRCLGGGVELAPEVVELSLVLIGVTELVDEPTEVVGLAGSPPAEDGCVQMLSFVPNTSISLRYKRPVDVMLILRYLPRASVVRFITTGVVPSSLTSENNVLSVLLERRSALWTERLGVGILLGATNVIFTLSTHHPWGMSSTCLLYTSPSPRDS